MYLCRLNLGAEYAGPLTIIFNSVIPYVVKLLLLLESHGNEGSRQESLYLKITLFRWVNTAILTKVITPFTSSISDGPRDVLVTINSILWSELFLSPFLRLIDIFGNLKKHIIAPRTRTQESMNLYFQGTPYNLGERYTVRMFIVEFEICNTRNTNVGVSTLTGHDENPLSLLFLFGTVPLGFLLRRSNLTRSVLF